MIPTAPEKAGGGWHAYGAALSMMCGGEGLLKLRVSRAPGFWIIRLLQLICQFVPHTIPGD